MAVAVSALAGLEAVDLKILTNMGGHGSIRIRPEGVGVGSPFDTGDHHRIYYNISHLHMANQL